MHKQWGLSDRISAPAMQELASTPCLASVVVAPAMLCNNCSWMPEKEGSILVILSVTLTILPVAF